MCFLLLQINYTMGDVSFAQNVLQNLRYSFSKRIKERNEKIECNNSAKTPCTLRLDLVKTPRLDNRDNNDICQKKKKKKLVKKINELNKNTNERNTIYDFTETPLLANKPPAGIKCHKKRALLCQKKKKLLS